jgi:Domain of unknown function (DUF4157)
MSAFAAVAVAAPQTAKVARVLPRSCACDRDKSTPCAECARKRIQRRASGGDSAGRTSRIVDPTSFERGGLPLPLPLRKRLEPSFGTSFADVRIHDDTSSHSAARMLRAEAFTCGQHLHFAPGRYRPGTRDGMHLLAHELTHTVQQRNTSESPLAAVDRVAIGTPDSAVEHEADRGADRIMAGQRVESVHALSEAAIQRKASPEVEEIDDLLSYGLFDWAITDAEANEALDRLKVLPRIEQAEFVSDQKYMGRLRDNLPADRVKELDAIANDVSAMLPPASTVDEIIDKLSYGLFDWAITDREAEEALDLLKRLSGDQLAIAFKRINYGRLMDNLPEARHQELIDLMAKALGTGGTWPTSESKEPGTALRSMDFVSDHRVMRNNTKDWSNSGKPYPQPDWAVTDEGEKHGGAISHTMGLPIEIDLGFDVLPPSAASASAVLTGKGSSPFLDFNFSGALAGGAGQRLHMTSPNKLPNTVDAFSDQSIDWTMKWGTWQHDLGTTGPFDIYTTVDKPAQPGEVTTKRMAEAVKLVAYVGSLKPHDVVVRIAQTWPQFNLDVRYANEWELAEDIETQANKGAQCIDIVRFVRSVIGIVGLPGLAEALIIWAQPSAPFHGLETPWGTRGGMGSGLIPPYPGHANWPARLLDSGFRPNNFEAALKFTADGTTKYYPGGVSAVFDNADDVLKVFQCLAWLEVRDGGYVIKDVPGPYKPGRCVVGKWHSFAGEAPS